MVLNPGASLLFSFKSKSLVSVFTNESDMKISDVYFAKSGC